MSKVHMQMVKCSACGQESPHKVWDMIDPMFDRSVKDQILSGELFTFHCPHCGHKETMVYDTSYQEMDKGRYFELVTSTESYERAINLYAERDLHSGSVLANEIIRIVLSPNQLAEKIRIFDEGLDDRVVEAFKLGFLARIWEEDENFEADECLFYKKNDEEYAVAFLGTNLGYGPEMIFPREGYDMMYAELKDHLPPIYQEIEVDMETVQEYLDFLEEQMNENPEGSFE